MSTTTLSFSDIARARLDEWAKDMGDNEATPVLCFAISHGKENLGTMHLYAPENLANERLADFLCAALDVVLKTRGAI